MIMYAFLLAAAFNCVTAVPLEHDSGDINRIANGVVAAEQQFPYAVSIQLISQAATANRGHLCGGVLFNLHYVLTTASCIYQDTTVALQANQLRVFAGAALLTNDTANYVRNVQNITIHPQYTGPPAYAFDIAILGLVAGFSGEVVTPIALPATIYEPVDFTTCQTAGWGGLNNANENVSVNLRYANKYIYNQIMCTLQYNLDAQSPNVLPNVVCAISYDMLSSGCQNDRGNPLVCDGVLTGLLSVTNNCLASNRPELFSRVSNYTTWIRTVSGAPNMLPGAIILALMTAVQLLLNKILQ